MTNKLCALIAAAFLACPFATRAAAVLVDLEITATDFALSFGNAAPPPISPMTIDFEVNFDNAADIFATSAGLTINSFNLPYPAQFAYSVALDTLILATSPSPGGCGNPPDSFCIFISNASTSPDPYFVQQSTSSNGYWTAQTISVTSVPEPATLLLLGITLGGLAFSRRRKLH